MPTPRHPRARKQLALAVLVPLILAATLILRPPLAFAGTYTVHTCTTPEGTFTGNGGWTSAASTPLAGYDAGSNTACSASGITIQFGGSGLPVSVGSWLSWDFVAPNRTFIQSYEIGRAFNLGWPVIDRVANRSYLMQIWHDDDVNAGLLDFKKPLQAGQTLTQSLPSPIAGNNVSWGSLHVSLSCWSLVGSLDCGPFPAQVAIARAQIGLGDDSAPGGFATGGSLTRVSPVRGTAGLTIHAFDAGGGVYRAALAVDGEEVSRQVLDAAGGACADAEPSNDDPYEFGTPQPCSLSVDGTLQLDTTAFADGQHSVQATVEDAGGNAAVIFDATVQTHNAPISAVAPALAGQASVGRTLTADDGQWDGAPTGFDHRWLRCDSAGSACTPVAGATGAAYVLTDADAYHRMRVQVTAENGSGAASAGSVPSALVSDAAGRTSAPTGTGQSGSGDVPPGGIQGIVNPLGQLPGHVANGGGASGHARIEAAFQRADGGTARRVTLPAGRRIAIVGRLTDAAGAGIAGARLGAAWRIVGRGWVARPGVRTRPDGRFVYLLPPGPSRDVRFTYFAFSDSRAVELSNVVRVETLAPLTIRADRRRVTGDRVVHLGGRVGGGGAISRTGLLVALQGYQQGYGWHTFRTVRTDRHGRWRTSYRFRSSHGRFGFRAQLPRQGRFPYATSRSAGVFVTVS
jgi:hypothetical protein